MEVTAYYSDNTSAVVTNYTYSPSGLLPYGTTQVVISYTEGGITATTTQAITVSIKTYDYTKSKVFSSPRNYSLADIGATHRNIRVVCIGGGTGGKGGKNGRAGGSIGQNSLRKGGGQSWSSEPTGGAGGAASGAHGDGRRRHADDFTDRGSGHASVEKASVPSGRQKMPSSASSLSGKISSAVCSIR